MMRRPKLMFGVVPDVNRGLWFCMLVALFCSCATTLPLLAQAPSSADTSAKAATCVKWGDIPLSFEPNRGQEPAEVRYLARGSSYTLYLADAEMVLGGHNQAPLRMKLLGANVRHASWAKTGKSPRVTTSLATTRASGARPFPTMEGPGTRASIPGSILSTMATTETWNTTGSFRHRRIREESGCVSTAPIACGSTNRATSSSSWARPSTGTGSRSSIRRSGASASRSPAHGWCRGRKPGFGSARTTVDNR